MKLLYPVLEEPQPREAKSSDNSTMNENYTGDDAFEEYEDALDDEGDPDRTMKSNSVPTAPTWARNEPVPAPVKANERYAPYIAASNEGVPPPPSLMRESAARERARKRRNRNVGGEWAWVVIAGVMIAVVGIISAVMLVVLGASDQAQAITPTATSVADYVRPTAIDLRTVDESNEIAAGQVITLDNGQDILLQPWDGEGRFTLLLMGVDRRPGDTSWAHLTDTMMLVSIDTDTNEIGLLSIPRDLYVPIQGYSEPQRINTPMVLGENRERGYGPTLAMQTVQYNLGIQVNEYLIVDFAAFIGLVDAIGGVTITTDYTINDSRYPSMNYGYDPFYLPAGTHDLDGYDALRFARTRHGDSDIHRARRQQQTLFAIRDKILGLNQMPSLVFQAPTLLANFNDNIKTGLDLDEMIELAWYVKDIPAENINTGVIDFSMLQSYTTASGAQVLIPVRSRIGNLMVEVFGADYNTG